MGGPEGRAAARRAPRAPAPAAPDVEGPGRDTRALGAPAGAGPGA
jgi:hypothetical protein